MSKSPVQYQRSGANPILAIDMTALWNRRTTGIQRVIREITPYIATAASSRGWEIVLVRKVVSGLELLTRWVGHQDRNRLRFDLDCIASGSMDRKSMAKSNINNVLRRTARMIRNTRVGPISLKDLTRTIRGALPHSVRGEIRKWQSKKKVLCKSADAFLSFSAGILPAMPPTGTPPDRSVFVIHDLIPLHHSHHYDPTLVRAFVNNVSDLAFSSYAESGRFVTASQHAAADIRALFLSLARKRIAVDVIEWGYDRQTFFPQQNSNLRKEHGIPENALLITAVSTQDPRKRFADIESAANSMNAYALFVGQGTPRRKGNAFYLGYASDTVVRQAYSTCDVVVNWSSAEGFGLSTIEALACGARVVVPPDNPTSIEIGQEHVFVAGGTDTPSLCTAIRDAALQPRPQNDLTRFDWAISAAMLESLLWPESLKQRKIA